VSSGPIVVRSPIDQYLEQFHFRHPVHATAAGVRLHDHELPDWSAEARDDEQDEFEALTIALDDTLPATDDASVLANDAELLDATLIRASMDVRQLAFESRFFHDRNPSLWMREAGWGILALLRQPPVPVEDAFASLAMRLHEVPRFLADLTGSLSEPVPAPWMAQALREANALSDLLRSRLGVWLDAHGADEPSTVWVLEAAEVAATAFDEAAAWMEQQTPSAEASLQFGAEAVGILLSRAHACAEDTDALLRAAQEELELARQAFESLTMDVAGSVDAWQEQTEADHPEPEQLLAAHQERWDACREWATDHDLVEWGDWPITYTQMPSWADDICRVFPLGGYLGVRTGDSERAAAYLVPSLQGVHTTERMRRLRAANYAAITVERVLQGGGLGQHVQHVHAGLRGGPRLGDMVGSPGAPALSLLHGATLTEGWAAYAATLADSLGFLSPQEQALRQMAHMHLVARAVVDLSLHTGVLTFDEAVELCVADAGMRSEEAEARVLAISMLPTSGVAAWLGLRDILALREVMTMHGDGALSLRQFHDALLRWGAIPVPTIGQLMRAAFA
jgi:hypothetical protein